MSDIRDNMMNAPRQLCATATALLLNQLQEFIEHHPGVQVVAIAAAFLLLCERFQVSPQDVFTATTNLINDHDGRLAHEFAAVRMYLQNEVR